MCQHMSRIISENFKLQESSYFYDDILEAVILMTVFELSEDRSVPELGNPGAKAQLRLPSRYGEVLFKGSSMLAMGASVLTLSSDISCLVKEL